MSCCGRKKKEARARAAQQSSAPLVYDSTARPNRGHCPICSAKGSHEKRQEAGGLATRYWLCRNGHVVRW